MAVSLLEAPVENLFPSLLELLEADLVPRLLPVHVTFSPLASIFTLPPSGPTPPVSLFSAPCD